MPRYFPLYLLVLLWSNQCSPTLLKIARKTPSILTTTAADSAEIALSLQAADLKDQGYFIDNHWVLQQSDRANLWIDQTPTELRSIASTWHLPCPDTLPTCAACGYCAFVKLSADWSYFGYEQAETKHFNQLIIFKQDNGQLRRIDTLYGTVVHAQALTPVYPIVLQEAYWGDLHPKQLEYHYFEDGHYTLKKTEPVPWQTSKENSD